MQRVFRSKVAKVGAQIGLIIVVFLAGYGVGSWIKVQYKNYSDRQVKKSIIPAPSPSYTQQIIIEGVEYGVPPLSASEQAKGEFSAKMIALARETTNLEFDNCVLQPAVVKATLGSNLMIKNVGEGVGVLKLVDNMIEIAPGEDAKLRIDDDLGTGLFGLECDNTSLSGLIYIEE